MESNELNYPGSWCDPTIKIIFASDTNCMGVIEVLKISCYGILMLKGCSYLLRIRPRHPYLLRKCHRLSTEAVFWSIMNRITEVSNIATSCWLCCYLTGIIFCIIDISRIAKNIIDFSTEVNSLASRARTEIPLVCTKSHRPKRFCLLKAAVALHNHAKVYRTGWTLNLKIVKPWWVWAFRINDSTWII